MVAHAWEIVQNLHEHLWLFDPFQANVVLVILAFTWGIEMKY